MFVVSSAFPLTSNQPPLAVVAPKMLATEPERDRSSQIRGPGTADQAERAAQRSEAREAARREIARNPFAVAGPPPSFEANILEIERRFETILARMELARSQREMRAGNGGWSETAAPDASSEGDLAAEAIRITLDATAKPASQDAELRGAAQTVSTIQELQGE